MSLFVMTPTSIVPTGAGSSASIGSNGRVTFTTCATISLNGVFTSSYDNYLIVGRHSTTADYSFRYRMRNAGTDDSTASAYVAQYVFTDSTTITAQRSTNNYAEMSYRGNTQRAGFSAYIFGPFLSGQTAVHSICADDYLGGAVLDISSVHTVSSSYDGITLIAAAGSFTGEVTVYGFNQ